MNLLLDTHIWIWSVGEPQAPYPPCRKSSWTDAQNQLWLSPISVWEALLLHRKGRLKLRGMLSSLGDEERWNYDAAD